ncbi:Phosphoribosylamine--glycine ligase [bioreactor metagenome]|uniref:Phosphoribosylamine--glycine ligase n=1 Tax=bioreactor metagenome TaxID=1076179 RepID=A0A644Y7V5_9ZZZZ
MQKLIILGASDLQLPTILKAKEKGVFTYVLDMNPQAVGVSYADYFENISTIDTEKVIDFANTVRPDGIMTAASDRPMKTVAAVCDALGLPGITKEVAERATNKVAMRLALEKAGVPIPKFSIISNIDEYRVAVTEFQGRYIVKPADNSGSRGIFLVEKPEDSDIAFNYSMSNSSNGFILVEEFVEGPEISVETITYNGVTSIIAVTDKITTGPPYFVELGHTQPSMLSLQVQENIRSVAIQAVEALGINNSPSHVELKITEKGPKIIELGARMGGDCITSHLVPLSTGVDMVGAAIDLALGRIPDIHRRFERASAIRYFQQTPGILEKINIPSSLPKEVITIHFSKKEGDSVSIVHNSAERIGYTITQADERRLAVESSEWVIRNTYFKYTNRKSVE